MTFQAINSILEAIAKQPKWEKQRQYHQLVQCWQKVVNDRVAQNTRPLYLQREILWVATSSSVWAQNLALQRLTLLKKLNQFLDQPIIDIRFSSARWYQKNQSNSYDTSILSQHPSSLNIEADLFTFTDISIPNTPQEAFLKWKQVIERRSPYLSICPYCQSPTPEGELKRWQMCSCCITKKFSELNILE